MKQLKESATVKFIYEPQPKQRLLHETVARQILYGGAAGGGKSRAMRMDMALFCIEVPGIHCYLFRKTYGELEDNHINFLRRELPQEIATFNVARNTFEFFNGSKIICCHCEHPDSYLKYMGAEMHILGIDEAGLFEIKPLLELRGRVRLGDFRYKIPEKYKKYLPRCIFTSNPGGPAHNFLKRTFISPSNPYKIFYDQTLINPRIPNDKGWTTIYIKATMQDNKHLDEDYGGAFSVLSPERARALRDGDWDAVEGMALHFLSKEKHKIREFKIPFYWTKFMAMDWGTDKPFSVGWYTVAGENTILKNNAFLERKDKDIFIPKGSVIRFNELYGWTGEEDKGVRLNSTKVAKLILDFEEENKISSIRYRIADSSMWSQFDGPSVAERMMKASKGKIVLHKSKKDRIVNYDEILCRLAGNPFLKYNYQVEEHPQLFITENCVQAWRTLPVLVLDEKYPNKGPGENQEDHVYDELAYACASRPMVMGREQQDYLDYIEAKKIAKQNMEDPYATT